MISLSRVISRVWQRQLTLGIAGLCLGVALVGCKHWSPSTKVTPVGELQQLSSRTNEIYLKGQVRQVVDLLEEGAYQLQDTTGKVWVVTSNPLPQPGDAIVIKGQLRYESIPVEQLELGEVYVIELERIRRVRRESNASAKLHGV